MEFFFSTYGKKSNLVVLIQVFLNNSLKLQMRLSSCNDSHCLNVQGNTAFEKNLQFKKGRGEQK